MRTGNHRYTQTHIFLGRINLDAWDCMAYIRRNIYVDNIYIFDCYFFFLSVHRILICQKTQIIIQTPKVDNKKQSTIPFFSSSPPTHTSSPLSRHGAETRAQVVSISHTHFAPEVLGQPGALLHEKEPLPVLGPHDAHAMAWMICVIHRCPYVCVCISFCHPLQKSPTPARTGRYAWLFTPEIEVGD